MAVSLLLIVRFEKFEIWHTLQTEPVLLVHNMTSRDVPRSRTSRARARTSSMMSKSHQSHQSLILNLVAASVAMGLSRKPCGRFSSFFACKLIWMRQTYTAKISRIGLISLDLEGFCITMATLWDFVLRRRSLAQSASTRQISARSIEK